MLAWFLTSGPKEHRDPPSHTQVVAASCSAAASMVGAKDWFMLVPSHNPKTHQRKFLNIVYRHSELPNLGPETQRCLYGIRTCPQRPGQLCVREGWLNLGAAGSGVKYKGPGEEVAGLRSREKREQL